MREVVVDFVDNSVCVDHHCVSFVFLRLVYTMLQVSLDCSFVIATSVFSNA